MASIAETVGNHGCSQGGESTTNLRKENTNMEAKIKEAKEYANEMADLAVEDLNADAFHGDEIIANIWNDIYAKCLRQALEL
jgi:hypothetical protein